MRFITSLLAAASVLLTVQANDKDWVLPKEAGTVAGRAVAVRAAVARAIQPDVSNAMDIQRLS